MSPAFLVWLGAQMRRRPGVLDCVLAHTAPALPADLELVVRRDLDEHPRVRRARRLRQDVIVYSDENRRGLVTIGRGLAGRLELSFEVKQTHQSHGVGRRLIAAALRTVPNREPVFAQASPGNAQSLRALLAVGFRPIGSEVLFEPAESTMAASTGLCDS